MAGKSGGAWKVAYADFVTAMMAFFLVMWISSQDQKIKESVSHYFQDPLGGTPFGTTRKPSKAGSVLEGSSSGAVPQGESVSNGKGRSSHSSNREHSVATRLVAEWLHNSDEANAHWRKQTHEILKQSKQAPEVRGKIISADDWAIRQLARQLNDEIGGKAPKGAKDLHLDLLQSALADVNWFELAEDLIAKADDD